MYAATYLREIKGMSFYAQASTIQVLGEGHQEAISLVLVLTSSANIYWNCPSCFTGATTRVSSLTFQSCLENTSIRWYKMNQTGLSRGRPEEEEKYDKWGPYSPLRKHCAGFAPNMPTASKKQILLAVIFLDAEINPAGDPSLKKTCSMVHSLCQSAKNHPRTTPGIYSSCLEICRDFETFILSVIWIWKQNHFLFPSTHK